MKRLAPRRHPVVILVLMAVMSLAFALEGSQPGHTHEDGRLGLYNAECPLAKVAAFHAVGWAPPLPVLGPSVEPAASMAVASDVRAPSPCSGISGSRAPP